MPSRSELTMDEENEVSAKRVSEDEHIGGYAVRLTSDSHFTWIRTRLSAHNTLMSWMRLATTLIGFGFTIVQFFERFTQRPDVKPALAPHLPRYLGLALMLAGIFSLAIAIWQYMRFVEYLQSGAFGRLALHSRMPVNKPALAIAILLLLIGAVAFVTVVFRLF
jgi:putative membrane protein